MNQKQFQAQDKHRSLRVAIQKRIVELGKSGKITDPEILARTEYMDLSRFESKKMSANEVVDLLLQVDEWCDYLHELYEPPVMLGLSSNEVLIASYEKAAKMFTDFADNVKQMVDEGKES